MKKFGIMFVLVSLMMPVWVAAEPQPIDLTTEEEEAQLARQKWAESLDREMALQEANQKLLKRAELCDEKKPAASKPSAAVAVTKKAAAVKRNPGLSSRQQDQVTEMLNEALRDISNSKCCEELNLAVNKLDVRLTKLEKDVETLKKDVAGLKAKDAELGETDEGLQAQISSLSSRMETHVGARFKFRLFSQNSISLKRAGDYNHLPYALFGGTFLLHQKMTKEVGSVNRSGYLMFGLSGAVGLSMQDEPSTSYATSGLLAWQWGMGLYLGGRLEFLVEDMNPSQHWLVSPAALIGVSVPGPAKDKKVAFFAELYCGPTARLSGEMWWRSGWTTTATLGFVGGIQMF